MQKKKSEQGETPKKSSKKEKVVIKEVTAKAKKEPAKKESAKKESVKKELSKKESAKKEPAKKEPVKKKPAKKKSVRKKAVKAAPQKTVMPEVTLFDRLGPIRKAFILDNIRLIDYRDLARLVGVKPEELKKAVESTGIKLPVERAKKWAEIDVGTFKSLADCARCQVQLNHGIFYVGLNKCKKCMERNIKLWIDENVIINIRF